MTKENKTENMHAGHRKRMLETYLKSGIDGFSDVETLEYLLSFAIPRQDTNPIAHRLLERFGALHLVMQASIPQLTQVDGIGLRTASLLHFVSELWQRTMQSSFQGERFFYTTQTIGKYFLAHLSACREERACLMCLDSKCKLLDFRELSRGTVNSVNLPYRRVVETALAVNAVSVVLGHNHPDGTSIPSYEDISYTQELMRILKPIGITLTDHIVIAEHTYCSMRYSGMLDRVSGDE